MNSSFLGFVALFGAAFLYGSQNIATRFTGIEFGPFLSTSLRFFVIVLFLFWFVKWKRVERNDWKWFILRAIGNIIATTGVFISVNQMSVGAALFSFYSAMIISGGLFGILFYKEKFTWVKFGSLLLTAFGLYLIYNDQSRLTFNWYVIVASVGGLGASLWTVFSRPISAKYSLKQLVLIDGVFVGIMAGIISLMMNEPWRDVRLNSQLGAIFYLGITQIFTGQLVVRGFKVVDAQIGSIILLNDAVVGMVLAYLFFLETASPAVIAGGVCILLSSIIPTIIEHRKKLSK